MATHLARRLKLQQLRLIVAIADQGSLLQATARLGLTQPALTRALRELETTVGGRLFERHTRGVTATALGERLLQSARRVLSELRDCEQALARQLGARQAQLHVGALPSAAVGVLPGAIARLHAVAPHVRIRIVQDQTDGLMAALERGDVDLVVGRLYPTEVPDAFERIAVYEDRIAVLARAAHPLSRLAMPESLQQLRDYPLVLAARNPLAGAEIDRFLERFDLQPAVYLESNSIALIRELLLDSDTITLLPRMMLAGDLLRGALREIAPLPLAGSRSCGIIRRRNIEYSAAAQSFCDALRAQVQELADAVPTVY